MLGAGMADTCDALSADTASKDRPCSCSRRSPSKAAAGTDATSDAVSSAAASAGIEPSPEAESDWSIVGSYSFHDTLDFFWLLFACCDCCFHVDMGCGSGKDSVLSEDRRLCGSDST